MGGVCCPVSASQDPDSRHGGGIELADDVRGKANRKSTGSSRYPSEKDRYTPDPTKSLSTGGPVSLHDIEVLIKKGKKVVKALYDYTSVIPAATDGDSYPDLNFKKGDMMEVTNEDGDWWLARSLQTGIIGYIPRTYVAPFDGLQAFEWFHGSISKKDVDKLLTAPQNATGTFLIRESETRPGTYVLSVLDDDPQKGRVVKHYRICNMDDGGCFITAKQSFKSLDELVNTYLVKADCLCCQLTMPCPRQKPQMYDLSRETRDHWEIPRSEIQLSQQLGAGNFGEVWRGKWKGVIDVAVKTMKPGSMTPEKFLLEAEVMKKLRHPRLVTLYAVCTETEPIYIVTELMAGGSLLDYLRSNRHRPLSVDVIIDIAAQIADGMWFIERERHIHRDLAARNILTSEDHRSVKIGDFGLSRVIDEEFYEMSQGARFPVKWTAPEAIQYSQFTIKSDVWAYGILLVELTSCGATPYPGMNNQKVVELLQNGYRHPKPPACPDALYEIMLQCWNSDYQQRPTFEYLHQTLDDFTVSVETGYKDPAEQ
jgi:hypothetical protein